MFPVGKASGGEFFAAGRVKGLLEYEGKRMGVEPEDCDGMTFHWLLKKSDMGREWRVFRKNNHASGIGRIKRMALHLMFIKIRV